MTDAERLEKLETTIAYQEQAIEDLNKTVLAQAAELAELKRLVGNLGERLREIADNPAGKLGAPPRRSTGLPARGHRPCARSSPPYRRHRRFIGTRQVAHQTARMASCTPLPQADEELPSETRDHRDFPERCGTHAIDRLRVEQSRLAAVGQRALLEHTIKAALASRVHAAPRPVCSTDSRITS